MYMKVKLNRTYIIEKKYFEILLRTTKNIFLKNYNILYMQNNFVVKILFEKLLEISWIMYFYFILFAIEMDIFSNKIFLTFL